MPAKRNLRSDSLLDYLTEAYGCQPCSVNLKKLNGEDIAQVRRLLIRPQRTRPRGKKRPIDLTTSEQLSPRSKRRKEDSIFTPPVPYPIQELEMETYDREMDALVKQIDCEHNYARKENSN